MILEELQQILSELSLAVRDAEKFDKGNASAGRRVRKSAMNAMKQLKEMRSHVMEELHERAKKQRGTMAYSLSKEQKVKEIVKKDTSAKKKKASDISIENTKKK